MRLSAIKGEVGYRADDVVNYADFFVIFDGERVADVVTADEEEGWIDQIDGGDIVRRHGRVQLVRQQ